MPFYSLIAPTRSRIYGIQRLLESLQFTTNSKSDLELLLIIDNDDTETKDYVTKAMVSSQYAGITVKPIFRERSDFLNGDYYTYGATFASGDFYWAIADDVVFTVVNWDIKIRHHLNAFLEHKIDKVVCAGIRDNTPKPKPSLPQFPCFPLISKEAFKAVGYFLHPKIPTWGADYLIYLLYTNANRYLAITDDVYLNHMSVHTKSAPKDETAKHIENRFIKYQHIPEHNIDLLKDNLIPLESEQLRQKIISLGGIL